MQDIICRVGAPAEWEIVICGFELFIFPEFLTSTVCFDIFIGCVHFYVGVLHPRWKQNRLNNCKSCLDTFSPLFTTCCKKSSSLPLRLMLCWTQLSARRNQQLAGRLGMIPFMTSQRVYFPTGCLKSFISKVDIKLYSNKTAPVTLNCAGSVPLPHFQMSNLLILWLTSFGFVPSSSTLTKQSSRFFRPLLPPNTPGRARLWLKKKIPMCSLLRIGRGRAELSWWAEGTGPYLLAPALCAAYWELCRLLFVCVRCCGCCCGWALFYYTCNNHG